MNEKMFVKLFCAAGVAAMAISADCSFVFAQEKAQPAQIQTQAAAQAPVTTNDMAQKFKEQFGLTDTQTAAVKKILDESKALIDKKIKDNPQAGMDVIQYVRDVAAETDNKVIALLNPEQKQKFEALKEQKRQEHETKRKEMIAKQVQEFKDSLGLNAEQSAKVDVILQKMEEKIRVDAEALKDKPQELNIAVKAKIEAADKEIEGVLTPEQSKKYSDIKEARRKQLEDLKKQRQAVNSAKVETKKPEKGLKERLSNKWNSLFKKK